MKLIRNPLLYVLHVLLAGFSALAAYLILGISPAAIPAVQEYPYTIVELADEAPRAVNALEEAGLGPVLWRESVSMPLNRGASVDPVLLYDLDLRLDADDLRLSPYRAFLLSQFDAPLGEGQLIMVPGDPENISAVLDELTRNYFIHRDRNLPRFAGLLLWVVTALAMLVFVGQRDWTAPVTILLFPLYLVQNPLFLAALSVLFIALKEIGAGLTQAYRDSLSDKNALSVDFPPPRRWPAFLSGLIRRCEPYRSAWVIGLTVLLAGISFLPGLAAGLLVLPQILIFALVLIWRLRWEYKVAAEREHELFVPEPLTPSWHTPARNERGVLILVLLLSLSLPFLFQVNSAPFPTRFIAPQQLVSPQSAVDDGEGQSDAPELVASVIALLEERFAAPRRISPIDAADPADQMPYPAAVILAEYAYQQAYPFVSVGRSGGAGRYENGTVYLPRFDRSGDSLRSFDEEVFRVDEHWIESQRRNLHPRSMLRLYSDGERWYDVRPESGLLVVPHVWNLVPEVLVLFILALPWLGRWQFAPVRWLVAKVKKRRTHS